MERYLIKGGRKLSGEIGLESAKNSVLPLLAASTLTDEEVVIKRCPKITDVINLIQILNRLGVKARFDGDDIIVNASDMTDSVIPKELSRELRASVFMLGALLSRLKRAEIAYPGGCDIGRRPIDIHLKGLEIMGVKTFEETGGVICTVDKLKGGVVTLGYPSVGATENVMIAAVLAEGKTEIRNCAKEPEIVDLMRFLNSMGAKVYGAGTSTILIDGVKKLHGTEFLPISDRIEAGTFLLATAITGGEIQLTNCNAKNICSLIHKLCDNACKINLKNGIIHMRSGAVKSPFALSTGPHPDFPTDLQAQATVLAAVSDGRSVITENVFERRFGHVAALVKMGADIKVKGRSAYVNGVPRLKGASVNALDLRGGAALVLAGLNAEGVTSVGGVSHIRRGYFNFEQKLRALGADIILQDGD